MAHAENNITINQPIEVVYNFVADGAHNPLWRPSVLDIKLLPGKSVGLGAVFKQGLKGPGGRIDGDYEITEFQPNLVIKFQVISGPARPTGTYLFKAEGSATNLTFSLHFEPKGLARLMDSMIASTMKSEVATLSNLKAYLERHIA
jgi:uncharacterized membrane protein